MLCDGKPDGEILKYAKISEAKLAERTFPECIKKHERA